MIYKRTTGISNQYGSLCYTFEGVDYVTYNLYKEAIRALEGLEKKIAGLESKLETQEDITQGRTYHLNVAREKIKRLLTQLEENSLHVLASDVTEAFTSDDICKEVADRINDNELTVEQTKDKIKVYKKAHYPEILAEYMIEKKQ